MEILVEGEARNQAIAASATDPAGQRVWTGRSSCGRVVNFMSDGPRNYTGRFVPLKITAATSLSLQGEILAHGGDPEFAEKGPGARHILGSEVVP